MLPLVAEHDPELDLSRLVWNRNPEEKFWFHYTTKAAASAIYDQKRYLVGQKAGLYVTKWHPGARTDGELVNELLDGTRELRRVQAAVVLFDDPEVLHFEQETHAAWVYRATVGAFLPLVGVMQGWAWQEDGVWRYHADLVV